MKSLLTAFSALAFLAAHPCIATSPDADSPPRGAGGERVEVQLTTLPFYAVDADGAPLFGLDADEVEIRVDGVPIEIDTFDRYSTAATEGKGHPAAEPEAASENVGANAADAAATSRHLFLLFDLAFSSPQLLLRSQELAEALLESVPETDHLYVLVNRAETGLVQAAGPTAATPEGREQIRRAISQLLPNLESLRPRLSSGLDMGVNVSRHAGLGVPSEQLHWNIESIDASGKAEYRAEAEDLAQDFSVLAASFALIREPKVMVMFSGGMDSGMYFHGLDGLGAGSKATEMYHVKARRSGPILFSFEGPLAELAESGVLPLFVNPAPDRASGRSALHHMGEATGGLYLESRDVEHLRQRIAGSTGAYYEAGFYGPAMATSGRAPEVEITIRRAGARAWYPRRLQTRRGFAALPQSRKDFLVLDLIRNGIESWRTTGPAGAQFFDLPGRVAAQTSDRRRRVQLRIDWPTDLKGRTMTLYDVVVEVASGDSSPELVRLQHRSISPGPEPLSLVVELDRERSYLWGIVAVDGASEATYFRRLLLQPESTPPPRRPRGGSE